MTIHQSPPAKIPDHVPPQLVQEFALKMGVYADENPFDRLVPDACEGPDVIYARDVLPGGRGDAWIFRRQEDNREIYNDTEHFSNKGFSGFAELIGEHWSTIPAETDAPEHTYFRTLLNPVFAPGSMAKMEGTVRDAALRCLEGLKDRNECDFMDDFAVPFPVSVVLDLMALPQERMAEFLTWERMLLHSGKAEVMAEGVRKVTGYLREVIAERKQNPGDDLISFAIKSDVNGRKMTDDELLGYAFNFYIGGLDTVSANLGNFFLHLATNLDHQRQLRQHPEKIREAIEEFLRVFAAVSTTRICIKEKTIRGVTLKPGDKIQMNTTLANRDKHTYENPHQVILDRNPSHVTFATGPHHCLGVHLARRELRIAMEEFFKAIPEFRLKPGGKVSCQIGGIIQPRTLPIVW